ncbi:MAG: glutamate-1-semialdehyde-2,1-aminomutase [Candidatus Handelsmanbacteria bacterium RIFCSPLOWO2_12_FULL_64_10]|uniref:Glutamate-1-semialdehyde 2,1-aminomutase n=1 Tax=Handelsmanbacteria sp. (strain RIFCSPLOWO2_12_FULL_64_10) TaxID=1817868 RepID=A0A1F6CRA8_HANXR|nr:MAG: glutamate-1-semialdehyde-2,1-aminomutase [Candidatus Handelsmanbacteria bacterium RIFCSPLOWO2_12_FULL_64_10]
MSNRSQQLFAEAQQVIPGGVNSPARAFGPVGGDPRFIARGHGSRIVDVDGNEYIDYVGSWGPLILGHAHPDVVAAVKETCESGTSFGAPTEIEVKMARLVAEMVPSVEMVRMVNSGTEATMSAVRLARGYTDRPKIVKFEGCWHGHADSFLTKAGSSALTLGAPDSPGVPEGIAQNTINAPYNDIEAVKKIVSENRGQIAAVIVEPVAGNMGVVPPAEGFLKGLREVTASEGIVLIFDEVITGFRLAPGGAQERFGVTPDLTTLGKIIGGGLPVGAFGGRREIMGHISPLGKRVSQAGTLSGNPLAMAAGYAVLQHLRKPGVYESLEKKSKTLADGLAENVKKLNAKVCLNRVGSMSTTFFTPGPVTDYASASRSDTKAFARYFREMLNRGIYIAPSQFEAGFVSLAHTDEDLSKTIRAHYEALKAVV